MKTLNTLVLYDSTYGNTEQIAQMIAQTLSVYGKAQAKRVDQAQPGDIGEFKLLVLGCPTQMWRVTPMMKAFLKLAPDHMMRDVSIACFDTRLDNSDWITGSAAKGIARQLGKMGISLLAPPESFLVVGRAGPLVEGELERAARWAEALYYKVKQSEALQQAVEDAIVEAVP